MSDQNFDVRASADDVVTMLRQGHGAEALARLEALRTGQPLVLQEALDRYVVGREAGGLAALHSGASPEQVLVLDRLTAAREAPRLPDIEPNAKGETELTGLTVAQQHDVYASMVFTRGNEAARVALARGDRVILGLRQENSTLAAMESAEHPNALRTDDSKTPRDESRGGTGVYNDEMVVLWRNVDGTRGLHLVARANTEPTAQYDHHAGSDGTRTFKHRVDKQHRQLPVPEADPSPGFEHVTKLKPVEGEDANSDAVLDAGRLREGTFEMQLAKHKIGPDQEDAFRPTPSAVRAGAGMVERDTNGDGMFDSRDAGGRVDLNDSFKIHRGSRANTDSAGCQTIQGPQAYQEFLRAARPDGSQQATWQYVLTSVKPRRSEPQPSSAVTPQQRDAMHRVYGQIGPTIQSNGYGMDEALRVCGACVAHEAKVGEQVRFVLRKDGERVAALHASGSMAEIDVAMAVRTPTLQHLSDASQIAKPVDKNFYESEQVR